MRDAPATHARRNALPLFLLAGLCLSSLDTTATYLVREHALFLVVWARYAGQMLVVTPFAWHRAGTAFLAHATTRPATRALGAAVAGDGRVLWRATLLAAR